MYVVLRGRDEVERRRYVTAEYLVVAEDIAADASPGVAGPKVERVLDNCRARGNNGDVCSAILELEVQICSPVYRAGGSVCAEAKSKRVLGTDKSFSSCAPLELVVRSSSLLRCQETASAVPPNLHSTTGRRRRGVRSTSTTGENL
jgi:hypothetical protein